MSNDTILLTLERLFEQDHDPVNALTLVFLDGLLQCTSRSPELRLTRIRIAANNNFNQDVLPALSLAEQCALVACKRVADKCPGEPVTFDALFDEYALGFGTSAKVHDGALLGARFSRSVMRTAVDGLLAKGILYRGDPDTLRTGISSMTVDTREEIHCRWPLSTLPNLMLRPDGSGASDSLRKLASEIL